VFLFQNSIKIEDIIKRLQIELLNNTSVNVELKEYNNVMSKFDIVKESIYTEKSLYFIISEISKPDQKRPNSTPVSRRSYYYPSSNDDNTSSSKFSDAFSSNFSVMVRFFNSNNLPKYNGFFQRGASIGDAKLFLCGKLKSDIKRIVLIKYGCECNDFDVLEGGLYTYIIKK
jgi:hypothetical protein